MVKGWDISNFTQPTGISRSLCRRFCQHKTNFLMITKYKYSLLTYYLANMKFQIHVRKLLFFMVFGIRDKILS